MQHPIMIINISEPAKSKGELSQLDKKHLKSIYKNSAVNIILVAENNCTL